METKKKLNSTEKCYGVGEIDVACMINFAPNMKRYVSKLKRNTVKQMDIKRTTIGNSLFSPIPELARVLKRHKKRDPIKIDKIPAWVNLNRRSIELFAG